MDDPVFADLTVVDATTFVTGGFASLMLANQGADVLKVEQPGVGDDIRHAGPPFVDGESPYFWTVNYDKRSVELDLRTDAGREALYDLLEVADVFLQNFRPETAERLGVDADTVRAHNEDLVYCGISAFGATGPWADRPGYDLLVQGLSGVMSVTGEAEGPPVKVGLPMTDLVTAMWAAFGVTAALYRRERLPDDQPGGEAIDLGMLEAVLPWLTKQAGRVFAGEEPGRMGTKDPVLAPYQTVATADGHLNVACLNDRLFGRLCEAIDRPDLLADDRFETNADRVEHVEALEAELAAIFAERSTDEWLDVLEEVGVPAGPVASVGEALSSPQVEARGAVGEVTDGERTVPTLEHPLHFAESSSGFEDPPPRLGEHTREVLREVGYDDAALERLADGGAFGERGSWE